MPVITLTNQTQKQIIDNNGYHSWNSNYWAPGMSNCPPAASNQLASITALVSYRYVAITTLVRQVLYYVIVSEVAVKCLPTKLLA